MNLKILNLTYFDFCIIKHIIYNRNKFFDY